MNFSDPYALEFDGVDDYIEVGDVTELDKGFTEFSISTWVYYHGVVKWTPKTGQPNKV
jgi:hypothetical protein